MLPLLLKKLDVNALDLRHFNTVAYSDCWDGKSTSAIGATTVVLLYQSRVVAQRHVFKSGGSTEGRGKSGSEFWWEAFELAKVYMRVIHISRYKYFDGNVDDCDIDRSTIEWDRVTIPRKLLQMLQSHPQFDRDAYALGITLLPLGGDTFRVEASKRRMEQTTT